MAEAQFKLDHNGQAVQKEDLELLGKTSGLADDRVLAELYRLTPFDGSTVARGILPFGHAGSGKTALVAPNGATGAVKVHPFRALIGSRTAVATSPVENWRDIRSGMTFGATTLEQSVSLAANSSGNPRWDLVYAAVAIDVNSASVSRKVKNPTTKVITDQTVSTSKVTTVTVLVLAGTPGASPSPPTIPADAGSTYYIPLANVRVPNGFGASSTVLVSDIGTIAPALALGRGSAGGSIRPASTLSKLTTAQWQSWGATGTRPRLFMPSSMVGGEALFVYLDLSNASSANWSHQNNGIVDDSRDWRGRLCKWMLTINEAGGGTFLSPIQHFHPNFKSGGPVVGNNMQWGFGQTNEDLGGGGFGTVAALDGADYTGMADGSTVRLLTDVTTGALKVQITGSPGTTFMFWIDFSAPFENA